MKILYIGDFEKKNGPSTVDILLRERFSSSNNLFNFIQSNRLKSKFLSISNYDIIHVSGVSFIGLVSLIYGRLLNKRCTMTMHGSLKKEKKFRKIPIYRIWIESLQIKICHRVFPVSSFLANIIKSKNITVIPNGFAKLNISNLHKQNNLITLIGGGRREKRNVDICKAVEKINCEYNLNININVFGEDGLDTDEIKSYSFVNYYGFCEKETVFKSLSNSNIFIQYSEYEPFSLSVCDAINYNCRIITSCNVGVNQFISENFFFKIVSDFDSLIKAINSFVTNKTDMISKVAYQHELLTWNEVSNLYLKSWTELLKK